MSNRLTSEDQGFRTHRSRAWLLPCLAIAMLVPAPVFAQPITMEAKSALYLLKGGDTLFTAVAEQGDTNEASLVTIEIRDAANVVRASTPPRNLVAGRPVILTTTVPAGPLQLFYAFVAVTIPTSVAVHKPVAMMEVIQSTSLTIKTLPPCAIPIEQMPSQGGGAEGNCGGWHLTSPTPGATSEQR